MPFVILFIAMIWFLAVLGKLPDTMGVHFAPDGNFDVYASKMYGFYPFAVGFGTMIIFLLFEKISAKIKTGVKVTEKGEHILRALLRIYSRFIIWIISLLFTRWAYSVITQTPINRMFLIIISSLWVYSIPLVIIAFIAAAIKYKA